MRHDGEREAGLLEELLQVRGHVEGGRLEVLGDGALQRRRVGRENGEGEDPPCGGDEAGGKGLEVEVNISRAHRDFSRNSTVES